MNAVQAYAISKKYTEDSLIGVGALKGAPCTILSIVDDPSEGTHTVTFEWTDDTGGKHTETMVVKDGQGSEDINPLTRDQMGALIGLLA